MSHLWAYKLSSDWLSSLPVTPVLWLCPRQLKFCFNVFTHSFVYFFLIVFVVDLVFHIKINTDEQKTFKYATEDLIIKKNPWSEGWNKWPGSCCCCFLTGSCQSLPSVSPRIVSYPTRRRWAELFSPGWTRDISPNQLYLCCFRKWLYWENK